MRLVPKDMQQSYPNPHRAMFYDFPGVEVVATACSIRLIQALRAGVQRGDGDRPVGAQPRKEIVLLQSSHTIRLRRLLLSVAAAKAGRSSVELLGPWAPEGLSLCLVCILDLLLCSLGARQEYFEKESIDQIIQLLSCARWQRVLCC